MIHLAKFGYLIKTEACAVVKIWQISEIFGFFRNLTCICHKGAHPRQNSKADQRGDYKPYQAHAEHENGQLELIETAPTGVRKQICPANTMCLAGLWKPISENYGMNVAWGNYAPFRVTMRRVAASYPSRPSPAITPSARPET